jgi:hypothetical protein
MPGLTQVLRPQTDLPQGSTRIWVLPSAPPNCRDMTDRSRGRASRRSRCLSARDRGRRSFGSGIVCSPRSESERAEHRARIVAYVCGQQCRAQTPPHHPTLTPQTMRLERARTRSSWTSKAPVCGVASAYRERFRRFQSLGRLTLVEGHLGVVSCWLRINSRRLP